MDCILRTPMVTTDPRARNMRTFSEAPKEIQSQYNDPRPQFSEGERLVQNSSEVWLVALSCL